MVFWSFGNKRLTVKPRDSSRNLDTTTVEQIGHKLPWTSFVFELYLWSYSKDRKKSSREHCMSVWGCYCVVDGQVDDWRAGHPLSGGSRDFDVARAVKLHRILHRCSFALLGNGRGGTLQPKGTWCCLTTLCGNAEVSRFVKTHERINFYFYFTSCSLELLYVLCVHLVAISRTWLRKKKVLRKIFASIPRKI